ncbi:hypothetical kinase [Postia placenta Mad-698-R]|nr:hypothetical kinase [Postia placenta Mad-698-R]
MSKTPPVSFPAPPNYIPEPPSVRGQKRPHVASGASQRGQDVRTSRFQDGLDFTWAPRPPPEDVYDRLEEYFPEHDLDRPVIDVSSGGSSPTSAENPAVVSHKYRHKRSIRHVAEEHKKTASRMEFQAPLRKRNTKLWGSKLEEVTTQQARAELSSVTQDSSPGGAAKPIFRWVRGELIGKGTYGKVYLALNATTGEMIAVKQVEMPRTASDKSDTRQVTVVEALKLESETLKDLDHPNIVQYLGFEETPTFLSIFLEYVPGGSIASCLRKHGKFDDEVSKSFTGQILDGLEYLHKRGILHRWKAWVDRVDQVVNLEGGMFGSETVRTWESGLDDYAQAKWEGSEVMRQMRDHWVAKVGWLAAAGRAWARTRPSRSCSVSVAQRSPSASDAISGCEDHTCSKPGESSAAYSVTSCVSQLLMHDENPANSVPLGGRMSFRTRVEADKAKMQDAKRPLSDAGNRSPSEAQRAGRRVVPRPTPGDKHARRSLGHGPATSDSPGARRTGNPWRFAVNPVSVDCLTEADIAAVDQGLHLTGLEKTDPPWPDVVASVNAAHPPFHIVHQGLPWNCRATLNVDAG